MYLYQITLKTAIYNRLYQYHQVVEPQMDPYC